MTIIVALVGIGLAYALNWVLHAAELTVPWWLDAPAALGFAGLLYGIFEKWGWRLNLWRKLGLVAATRLSGKWTGRVTSSYQGDAASHEVSLEIKQTWTRISVTMTSPTSRSLSMTAGLSAKAPAGAELTYTYRNEPLPHAVDTMNIHYGTATLTLGDGGSSLAGEYYSGRGRQTYGSIDVRRDD